MSNYVHTDQVGKPINLTEGKEERVGRNYMLNIKELNNEVEQSANRIIGG